jgi:hypothetical protein
MKWLQLEVLSPIPPNHPPSSVIDAKSSNQIQGKIKCHSDRSFSILRSCSQEYIRNKIFVKLNLSLGFSKMMECASEIQLRIEVVRIQGR